MTSNWFVFNGAVGSLFPCHCVVTGKSCYQNIWDSCICPCLNRIKPDQETRRGSSVGREKSDLKRGDIGERNQERGTMGMDL